MEILKKITALKFELDALRPLDADREAAIVQKLRLDWNFHSNHLEGNSLSFGETKALILFGITAAGKPLKDHFEITGHDEAIKWVEEVVREERPLTEHFIRQLHKLILKEPYEVDAITPDGSPSKKTIAVGAYKTTANHVRTPTGEIFRFATPEETPAKMADLIEWYRLKKVDAESHPLLLAAEFHYKFIRIHPFDDGNGRTARILMNFILMQNGYPPVIVRTEDKANYLAALRQADAGMITPFIEYIGQNLEQSLDLMLRGAKGENFDEVDDVDKELVLIEQKLNEVGKGIKILKSLDVIVDRFKDSFKMLFEQFITESEKFNRYYRETQVSYAIGGQNYNGELTPDFFDKYLEEIVKNENRLQRIGLSFVFRMFNGKGMDYFDFKSSIFIVFEKNHYKIVVASKGDFKVKFYHEKISEKEIGQIIRIETKAHTDFINQQIESAQKKHE